jgi:hypothetical protein
MKKIKLMIASLSILAVVGGALAFSTNTGTTYCTADLVNGVCPQDCPNLGRLKAGFPDNFVCTTTTSGLSTRPCKDATGAFLTCYTSVNSSIEGVSF